MPAPLLIGILVASSLAFDPPDALAKKQGAYRASSTWRAQRNRVRPTGRRGDLRQRERRAIRYGSKQHPQLARERVPIDRALRRAAHRLRRRRPDVDRSIVDAGLRAYAGVRQRVRAVADASSRPLHLSTTPDDVGLEIVRVDLPSTSPDRRPRVLIVGGVHAGTERVGVEAATRFIERAAHDRALRAKFDITVLPLVTPSALVLGDRKNAAGRDVNRSFTAGEWTTESRVVADIVAGETFDMVLDIHGAGSEGRDGFFVVRNGDDGGMADRILSAMPTQRLLDVEGAAGRPARTSTKSVFTFDSLGNAVSSNEGTLKAHCGKRTRYTYTLEAPTRVHPEIQVGGTLRLIDSALRELDAERSARGPS